jgi:hypothetical protein
MHPKGGESVQLSSFPKQLTQTFGAQYGESTILEQFGHAEEDGP